MIIAVINSYGRDYWAQGETAEQAMTCLLSQDEDFRPEDITFYDANHLALRGEMVPRVVPITV